VSPKLSITPSKSKEATSINHRHLSLLVVEDRVPSQNGDVAAIIRAFSDGQVHGHEQGNLTLGRGSIETLSLPHHLRVPIGVPRVLYHVHYSERCH